MWFSPMISILVKRGYLIVLAFEGVKIKLHGYCCSGLLLSPTCLKAYNYRYVEAKAICVATADAN